MASCCAAAMIGSMSSCPSPLERLAPVSVVTTLPSWGSVVCAKSSMVPMAVRAVFTSPPTTGIFSASVHRPPLTSCLAAAASFWMWLTSDSALTMSSVEPSLMTLAALTTLLRCALALIADLYSLNPLKPAAAAHTTSNSSTTSSALRTRWVVLVTVRACDGMGYFLTL